MSYVSLLVCKYYSHLRKHLTFYLIVLRLELSIEIYSISTWKYEDLTKECLLLLSYEYRFHHFSVHKQKTKKSLRDLYKMGIVYLWRIYACIYNYLLENVLEKHPCYNCGDPIIFPTTGMLINMQFVEKRNRTYFEMLRTL